MVSFNERARGSFVPRRSDVWQLIEALAEAPDQNFDGINDMKLDPNPNANVAHIVKEHHQHDRDEKSDSSLRHGISYPNPQAICSKNHCRDQNFNSDNAIRAGKRKRENDTASQKSSYSSRDAKKHQILSQEDQHYDYSAEYPDANYTMMLRRHLMSLHDALRTQWVCICQKCSALNVGLSLPPPEKTFDDEASFKVFFGIQSEVGIKLQEANITIRDMQSHKTRSDSELIGIHDSAPELAHICRCVTESLGHRNCLHLALEGGLFQRLHPQPKMFGGDQMPRTVSLSSLFQVQQIINLRSNVMTTKGRRVLALTLATALFPFLETPWLQTSFDHSDILLIQPEPGDLPDITRPFLALKGLSSDPKVSSDSLKQEIHPDASVLALGILLCELHYSTPLVQKDLQRVRNANEDYYTGVGLLKTLGSDIGEKSWYYLATKACVEAEYNPFKKKGIFGSSNIQRLFYHQVIKRLEAELFSQWNVKTGELGSFDPQKNKGYWGPFGQKIFCNQTDEATGNLLDENIETLTQILPYRLLSDAVSTPLNVQPSTRRQSRGQSAEPSTKSLCFFDASHQTRVDQEYKENDVSQQWMLNFLSSIDCFVNPFDSIDAEDGKFEPVRIAILDSGFDLKSFEQPAQIKGMRNFVHSTTPNDIRDEVGHGTHALGLLLQIAPYAEIYLAKIANQENMDSSDYDGITKAINHAVSQWKVDVISMSFGIRQDHEPIRNAIANALYKKTLLFAAASNSGANSGRAFPAKHPGVFCIHSTDGNGNPSAFNPTAIENSFNFSLLGENVTSHWPFGTKNHEDVVKSTTGTSVATPIAAGLAAAILSFVRQQEQNMTAASGDKLLGERLKETDLMEQVFKSMVIQKRRTYDYITVHELFDKRSTKEQVYNKIMDVKKSWSS